MNARSALSAINKHGVILVFPISNRKDPASLWYHFFPNKKMRWEWDASDKGGVSDLWQLRAQLSTSKKAVYTKWYQNRATYFSKKLFVAMLRGLNPDLDTLGPNKLSPLAKNIFEILESDSPLSTKELKKIADLRGRENESAYNRALKELWSRLLIVAYGEVDDGSFPSLAVGSTQVLFEDLWKQATEMPRQEAMDLILSILPKGNLFLRHFEKLGDDLKGSR